MLNGIGIVCNPSQDVCNDRMLYVLHTIYLCAALSPPFPSPCCQPLRLPVAQPETVSGTAFMTVMVAPMLSPTLSPPPPFEIGGASDFSAVRYGADGQSKCTLLRRLGRPNESSGDFNASTLELPLLHSEVSPGACDVALSRPRMKLVASCVFRDGAASPVVADDVLVGGEPICSFASNASVLAIASFRATRPWWKAQRAGPCVDLAATTLAASLASWSPSSSRPSAPRTLPTTVERGGFIAVTGAMLPLSAGLGFEPLLKSSLANLGGAEAAFLVILYHEVRLDDDEEEEGEEDDDEEDEVVRAGKQLLRASSEKRFKGLLADG